MKTVCVKAGGHCSTASRSLGRLVVKPSAPYQSFTHAEGSYTRGRDFPTSSWGDTLLPLNVHTSSFGCHSAVLILFLCSKSEVSHVQKRPLEWCTCVWVCLGALIQPVTNCFSLSTWAQLLVPENLNTLHSQWEVQRKWTPPKIVHVLSRFGLLSLNIRPCQSETAFYRKEWEQSGKSWALIFKIWKVILY